MRAYKIFPLRQIKSANLSKAALARLCWFDWYQTHDKNISLTCRHFGISRDTFYHWKKKFKPYNLKTLEDDKKNRRPHKVREMITPLWVQKKIYDIRLSDREKSKYEIQEELKREGTAVGRSTIQKVINRHSELLNTQHVKKGRDIRAHWCRLTPNISMFWASNSISSVPWTAKADTDSSGATKPSHRLPLLTS